MILVKIRYCGIGQCGDGWEVKIFVGIIGMLVGESMEMNGFGEEKNILFIILLKNYKIFKDKCYKKGIGFI